MLAGPSIRHWPAVAVVAALVVVFGAVALSGLPIQLLPNLEEPRITVENAWRAAAPEEMESGIVEPQEDVLKNIPGLTSIETFIARGAGWVNLTFETGTDVQAAKLDVINRLGQTPPLPVDAMEPVVMVGGQGFGPGAASLLIRVLPGNPERELANYQALIEEHVEPRLARIPGVSRVNLQGERPRELQIAVDTYRAAALGLALDDISRVVSRAVDVSGGSADVGRRRYTVRFVGQFEPEDLNQLVVGINADRPVYLSEIADVSVAPRDQDGFTLRNGFPSYYITVDREFGSNTVDLLDEVNIAIRELNAGPLAAAGLAMDLSFDSSVHIRRAVALVRDNVGLGLLLAAAVLYALMRSRRGVVLIAATVPLCLFVAFVALSLGGRSLNVISLAGLAFAVGIVMDAAIITLENIVRLRQAGADPDTAVTEGTRQVTGALFASTATSVAIFLPVLFIVGIEGQLFRDLALTLSVAVAASFLVAVTALPVAARGWLGRLSGRDPWAGRWERLAALITRLTATRARCAAWAGSLLLASVAIVVFAVPSANLLPQAPADSINAGFMLPPGGTVDMLEREIAMPIVERLEPYMNHEVQPYIRGYNLSAFGAFNALFLYPQDPRRIDEMMRLLREEILVDLPDTRAFVQRSTLLNFGFDGGRSINLDFQGPDIGVLTDHAARAMQVVDEVLPGAVVRPVPGLSIAEPELEVVPDDRQIAAVGLDRATVARTLRTVTGGSFVGEHFDGNERMDIILKGPNWRSPEELAAIPLATPLGGVQTIGNLTRIRRTVGPTQLLRVDGARTVTLSVLPPPAMTVEEALNVLRDEVGPVVAERLPGDVSLSYRGTADRLEAAMEQMGRNIVLAVLILFLIMAALFRSVRDSLLVLAVMPLALAGGVVSLNALNLMTVQSLDLLTMIGFIILLGLIVNNAILLVMQTRVGERNGLARAEAVEQAVRLRARPIYMSTATSLFGMLPLALIPGVGSEIYRGLAVVIIGGLAVSALFSLIFIPALLKLGLPAPGRLPAAARAPEAVS